MIDKNTETETHETLGIMFYLSQNLFSKGRSMTSRGVINTADHNADDALVL